jgi:Ca2+-binding EF-hand superfamily protein
MDRYEAFFRKFCKDEYIEFDYMLRANLQSFNKGLTYYFGGRENKALCCFIYDSISKSKTNHEITFSEFLNFARNFLISKEHQNLLIFRMITDHHDILTPHNLLRTFVNVPKNSRFSEELRQIIDFYTTKTLKPDPTTKTSTVYDKDLYGRLIPYSCLA